MLKSGKSHASWNNLVTLLLSLEHLVILRIKSLVWKLAIFMLVVFSVVLSLSPGILSIAF